MSRAPEPGDYPRAAAAIATWFGAGKLPVAPGTWGSLAALPAAVVLILVGGQVLLAFGVAAAFFLGVWAAGHVAAWHRMKDPGLIVIDEVAGQWLALLPVAHDWRFYPVAFILFRFVDITKPWPTRTLERAPGGMGIMADDIAAGAYAGILTWLIAAWFGAEATLPTLFG